MRLIRRDDAPATLLRSLRRAGDLAELGQVQAGRQAQNVIRRIRREPEPTPWVRAAASGAVVGLGAGLTLTAVASAVAGYFARVVVTPVKERVENLEILAVVSGSDGDEVILPATDETVVDGTYGLYFHGGQGFARIGDITSFSPRDGTLARRIEYVTGGDLRTAVRGWWSSVTYQSPADLGLEFDDVLIDLPGGPAPAWHVPPADSTGPLARQGIWAIMVHGRGGARTEGLKALGAAQRLGIDSLLISYRNDGEAPPAPDGRYGLGITEWEDVEAAIRYALEQGAEDIVLFGWSMGGAIALQTVDRSPLSARVRGLVLTGPVIDWIDVLAYQARALRIPEPVGRMTRWFISHRAGRRVTGLASPVDLKVLNWISRSEQLRHRTLILHSIDDDVVPYGPSRDLAEMNERVTFVPFTRAKHVKEWNHKPERWDEHVEQWMVDLFAAPAPGQTGAIDLEAISAASSAAGDPARSA
ncbi:alpha/beta hydrolase family protein [Nesterenkonia alba]|uniref:alpha/beta hydrolase family protein n=1 Tax=Nesterenkonia alba TaxID=515814 RepID=UPI0003B70B65|nr:alpha/beta hydrolase [Nesterenkonia alba]